MTTPQKKQTISYLTRRFAEVGLEPNRRHGQNFLIDYNLIELLARSAELTKQDIVLEVGTGTGALTALLAPQVGQVVTVEIDGHLIQIASEELESFENIRMLHQDALKSKNRIDAGVLEAVREAMSAIPDSRLKLAANLPYNIATPLISNLLRWEIVPDTMTVTIQKELADRILASPGTKDYGALSVWVQSICDVSLVRVLPPSVFWPRPKVDSAILHIEHRPERRAALPDVEFFHGFVRSMFFHRRKFLRSVAISAFKDELTKPQVDEVLTQAGLGPTARTEELSVVQMQELCELFRQQMLALGLKAAISL
ncbi:MAG: 16S rRNA (adenine(1518)-N(6)/adenine(1519)-N(6))-dimethyltransferase RsmA [Pirellulaceae bacterium]